MIREKTIIKLKKPHQNRTNNITVNMIEFQNSLSSILLLFDNLALEGNECHRHLIEVISFHRHLIE